MVDSFQYIIMYDMIRLLIAIINSGYGGQLPVYLTVNMTINSLPFYAPPQLWVWADTGLTVCQMFL